MTSVHTDIEDMRNERPVLVQVNGVDRYIVRKISEFMLNVITYYDKTGVYHIDGEKLDTLDTRPVFHEEEVRALECIFKNGIGLREERE